MKLPGSAVVLAGGQSRRMGQDKTALPWGSGSLLEHIARSMQAIFDDVLIVSGATEKSVPGVRSMRDAALGTGGPMAGLLTGLEKALYPWTFAVAADMPFINAEAIRFLWSLTGKDYQAVIPLVEGQKQPLAACYHQKAGINGKILWAQGERSLHRWADALPVRWVRDWEWRRVDPSLRMLTNLNTPQDYERTCTYE